MINDNIVNEQVKADYELILNACSRVNTDRDKGLSIINKYFGGSKPQYSINDPIPDQGDWTPLAFATFFGRAEEVNLLIKLGANVKNKLSNDTTLLHLASNDGKDKLCELFLKKGIDVNSKTSKHFTPMMGACRGGFDKVVNTLLLYSPDITIKDLSGKTCLDYGVDSGNYSIVSMVRHAVLTSDLEHKVSQRKKVSKI